MTDPDILADLGQPFNSFVSPDGTEAPPFFSTVIDNHTIIYDLTDPDTLRFCDHTDGTCYTFGENGLHIYTTAGGDASIKFDFSTFSDDTSSSKRSAPITARDDALLSTLKIDTPFDAIAGFVDMCNTELTALNPLPEFFFDGVICDPSSQVDGTDVYMGACKFVSAAELKCRDIIKSTLDFLFSSSGLIGKVKKVWDQGQGKLILATLASSLEAYFGAAVAAAAIRAAAAIAVRALLWYGIAAAVVIQVIGSENLAIVACVGVMSVLDPFIGKPAYDVTVTAHGETFTIASLADPPDLGFVNTPAEFKLATYPPATPCGLEGNLIRNGGFEDDGGMAPFPNGLGWWLPVAPTDLVEFSSFTGWQVTTTTNPQSALVTTGCLTGARCLQLYAFASGPSSGGGARVYQLIKGIVPKTTYRFTYSYRIDFLDVLSGTLDGASNFCYIFPSFHDSDFGQPGYLRFSTPVFAGTGEWQTVTRMFTAFRGTDISASADEFQILFACNAPTADVRMGITIDNLSAVPV